MSEPSWQELKDRVDQLESDLADHRANHNSQVWGDMDHIRKLEAWIQELELRIYQEAKIKK